MFEEQDARSLSVKQPSREPSTSTPAIPSDNPLDAPEGPRPENEDADAQDDEEMTGVEESAKKETLEKESAEAVDGAVDDAQTKTAIETSARSHLIAQTHAIILPSYSTWFDMHSIHNLERKALPEFFNSRNRSKTPAVYKDYRDFMVNTYRLNPAEYLTVTACRRNLAGDVCAIMRVHAFLEQWGLINYQVDPDTRPSNIGPPFTGHFRITADTPRGLQAHQPAPGSVTTSGKPFAATERLANSAPPSKSDLNLEIRRNIYESNGKEATLAESKEKAANGETAANGTSADTKALEEALKEPGKQFHCYSCGIDCTRVRYHNSKSAPHSAPGKTAAMVKYDLCPNCFLEGRFPASSKAAEYTKIENERYSALPDRDAPWTDAETLLLLEGLELFDEDWNSVADHVASRTREECVLKFLQLEIEDKYLEADVGQASAGAGAASLGYLSNGRVPFSQADNPVMSVMGFLATLAEPSVAAAAAGKSVEELKRTLLEKLEKTPTASAAAAAFSKSDKGKEKATSSTPAPALSTSEVKNEDAMEVDSAHAPNTSSPRPNTTNAVAATASSETHGNPLATIPFALSAARSSALASHEERHITRLVSGAVNLQLQKLSLKLQQFNELETLLSAERRDLERRRQQLFLDRLAFQKRVKGLEDAARRVGAGLSGGAAGAINSEEAVRLLTEAVRDFGVGKGDEKMGVMTAGLDGREVGPVEDGGEGFGKLEI
ncbi:SWIRM-domain-containing protein [Lepidopterella palustris CBS 459.81]|uniref:SWIRM-domain-containing protein n=1 Tax=Lepidopterella palustris CBS 459.81 TaxID=1314670 RepID=A0A8E2ELN0_9PEZI|nr:SWIRM-domain-containing protein [Lepidopterella palustris CBS 459.81]